MRAQEPTIVTMSLADRLRRETRAEHRAIEAALGLGGNPTLERYRDRKSVV